MYGVFWFSIFGPRLDGDIDISHSTMGISIICASMRLVRAHTIRH